MPLDPAIRVLSRSKKAAALPPPPSASIDLHDDRVALAAARADRGAAEPASAAAQLMHQRAATVGAGGSDRMAEGDRPTVHVHLVVVDLERPDRVDRDRCESLVDLPEVDVARLLADLLERLHGGPGGRLGEVRKVVGDLSIGEHGGG